MDKAPPFRATVADHTIGNMTLLILACVLASVPTFASPVLNSSRKTIQEQCDVRFGRSVDRAQALCIVSRAGMPRGVAAWDVTDKSEGEEGFWSVFTPLTQPQDSCFEAFSAGVGIEDGIIAWFYQGEACAGDGPLPPFSRPSRPEPSRTPSIQTQCGILPSQDVTREQAVCVAERAGAMKGISSWLTSDEPDSWVITVPLYESEDGCSDKDYGLRIRSSDGQILDMGFKNTFCLD